MSKAKDVKKPTGIPLVLGGETRLIKFDLNAFADLEDIYGDVDKAMTDLSNGSIKALRSILWAGISHAYRDEDGNVSINLATVGSWIDIKDLPTLGEQLGEVLEAALPEVDDEDMPEDGLDPLAEENEKRKTPK